MNNIFFHLKKHFIPLAATGLFLWAFCENHLKHLLGKDWYFHDNLAGATNMFLFYDRFFQGQDWLWSLHLNRGHPLWPVVETMPIMDPVAFLVFGAAYFLRLSPLHAFQITSILWLLLFSLGGVLCLRRICRNSSASILVFFILFSGPLSHSMIIQSYGFLLPIRYLPFCMYFYLKLIEKPNLHHSLLLGFLMALSWSGYQSVYFFIPLLVFCVIHFVLLCLASKPKLLPLVWGIAVSAVISLLGLLPTIAFYLETSELVAMPRIVESFRIFLMPKDLIWDKLFAPLWEPFVGVPEISNFFHGWNYIGLLPLIFVIFSVLSIILGVLRHFVLLTKNWRSSGKVLCNDNDILPLTWLLFALLLFAMEAGGLGIGEYVYKNGSLLQIRNFGFLWPSGFFGLSQLVGIGMHAYHRQKPTVSRMLAFSITFSMLSIYMNITNTEKNWFSISCTALAFFLLVLALFALKIHLARTRLSQFASPETVITLVICIIIISQRPVYYDSYGWLRDNIWSNERGKIAAFGRREKKDCFARKWTHESSDYWPFHLESPAVIREPVAVLNMTLREGAVPTTIAITHQFRLKHYHNLLSRVKDDDVLRKLLGVNLPIINGVASIFASSNENLYTSHALFNEASVGIADGYDDEQPSPLQKYAIKRLISNDCEFEVVFSKQGYLIFSDNYADDWRVYVDNSEKKLLRIDEVNKVVSVQKGKHSVRFYYFPRLYVFSFYIRAVLYLIALMYLARTACRKCFHDSPGEILRRLKILDGHAPPLV